MTLPTLAWVESAGDVAGYERVELTALRGPVRAPAVAVLGVRLQTLEELKALHGYVLEPAARAGTKLLVECDRKLSQLDERYFVDEGFEYGYTLERALHAAARIWRPVPAPAPGEEPLALDAEQLRAVRAGSGVVQVIAPAGSGKTTVLIERVRELLARGFAPASILATTFNRDARVELALRLSGAGVRGVEARTFHSLGLAILNDAGLTRRNGVRSLGLNQWKRLCAVALRDTGTWIEPGDARAAVADIKLGTLCTPREYSGEETLARIYELYEADQQDRGVNDFDDMVMLSVRALRSDPALRRRWQQRFGAVLVDEYQDIEPAQELLVRILAAPEDELFCVGDDDQTLYGFRRASVRRMLDLDRAYPGLQRVALAHNYRCPPAVVLASRALIGHNTIRFEKPIEPALASGREIELHEPESQALGAARIARVLGSAARGEAVVLARTSNMLRTVAVACADAGVMISAPATVFEPRGARAAIEAHLRLCSNPDEARADDVALVCRTPNRGLPYEAEEHAAELLRDGFSFTDAFAALGASPHQRGKLDGAGRTLDALSHMTDARRFVGYLRRRGGLDAYFTEHDAAFGDTEQIELEVLEQAEAEAEGLTVASYRVLLERRTDALRAVRDDEHGIELTTIHRAKGRQWPRVELFACEEIQMPHAKALDADEAAQEAGEGEEAERRLAYVAFTRAQDVLSITATLNIASRFLSEAGLQPRRPYRPPPPPLPPRGTFVAKPAAPAHTDPKVAKALGEAVRVGLNYALRTAPDHKTAVQTAVAAIERRLVGEATTSDGMTVAKLLAALEGLSDADRAAAISAAGLRETALVARLDTGAQKRLVRVLLG